MSRRTAIVEEFDDDTDLPLPSRALVNTGSKGAILEEIASDTEQDEGDLDDFDYDQGVNSSTQSADAGPANVHAHQQQQSQQSGNNRTVTDITPYKSWTCVYPIYIDAKRAYGTGERRIAREKSIWWPLSKDIADATNRLGLGTLHEVNKCHPRDWDNPGRIRVQWKRDGKLINPHIKSKKQLLEMIAFQIQRLKPEYIPKAPYTFTPPKPTPPPQAKSNPKGKQPQSKPKQIAAPVSTTTKTGCRLPVPPEPQPALASRLSPYSPAIATGVLIETIKAGMNAQEGSGAAAAGSNLGQKGKRKVVRVRA